MAFDARAELDQLIRQHGEDYASISRLLGRNPAYIQQFIKRGTPQRLSEDDRFRLSAYFRVDEERLGGRAAPSVAAANPGMLRNARIIMVPRVEISASAGPGGIAEIEQRGAPLAFDATLLRDLGATSSGLSVIRVTGDSMEPTLSEGDDILVDRNDVVDRLRAGVYVLRVEDVLLVKRLAPQPGARFVIRSDNSRYPDWSDYDPASVHLIGRVLWAGRHIR